MVNLLLLVAPLVPPAPDYQKRADAAPWAWSYRHANLQACIDAYLKDYDVEVTGKDPDFFKPLTIRIRKAGKEIYAWQGHRHTVFARHQDTLFVADYCPLGSGCTVRALDLKTGKQLWETDLRGIEPEAHSAYGNRVLLETDGKVITVRGAESHGCYLEFVDCRTGRTVGHKRYPRSVQQELDGRLIKPLRKKPGR
jgi:hypothetical protein